MVQRAWRGLVLDGRTEGLAANDTVQAEVAHQAFDRAAGDVEPLAQYLSPDLARAIDLEVLADQTGRICVRLNVRGSKRKQPSSRRSIFIDYRI